MKERESDSGKRTGLVRFVPDSHPTDGDFYRDYKLRGGHAKKYRGKHRSHTRGKGSDSFFRKNPKRRRG